VLKNSKVEMFIDDGRRWLIAHPNEKFDAVVMNTTWHFRDHASSLLSEDFLLIIRQHLNPGGIHYYNTTESTEVMRTGATVFPYSMRFFNFFAVSDSPFQIDSQRWRKVLVDYKIDGKPVFQLDRPEELESLNHIVSFADQVGQKTDKLASFEPGTDFPQRFRNSRLITDDNMGTEWFY